MKIAVCSDLHLEFADLVLKNDGADVLVLSGDILVARDIGAPDPYNIMEGTRSQRIRDFLLRCANEFPHVVYVMGNHEHYDGDFPTTPGKIRALLGSLNRPNVRLLDKEALQIDDVTFIGGTLWTDMNNEDELTLHSMSTMMNDFRLVTNSDRQVQYKAYEPISKPVGMTDEEYLRMPHEKRYNTVTKYRDALFTPEDAVVDHRKMLEYIKVMTAEKHDKKFVVCGHHAPSKQSTHPRYKHETTMNGGYSSDLDDFIKDRPQIKLWTHGHTHEVFDYMVGETRIVCNPRGYKGYEQRAEDFELKYVEV